MAASDFNENKAKKKAGSTEEDRIEKKAKKSKIRNAAHKDESSITFYLHASLFLFFLTSYSFLLFLYKNKYPLILNNEILPEVLFFCFGLLVFSFLSLFLLSFWRFLRFLARIFIAVIAGGAIAYILGLVFPYNIGNYVAHYLSFLPQNVLMYLAANGNMIAAAVSGLLMFILLNIFKGGAMAFLSLPVLIAIFMLFNTASKQVMPEKILTPDAVSDREKEKTENLIYLILADHTGYSTAIESWQQLNSKNAAPETLPFSPTFIPSFYRENNFTFYPAAYLRFYSKARNIGAVLNPSLTEITDGLLSRNDAVYYIGSDDSLVSATRNDLFGALKKNGYHLNVYQSYPFDFCTDDEKKNIDSCITYPAPLGALYQTGLSTQSRVLLLFGHWLYSTPFGKQAAEFVYTRLNKKIDVSRLPVLGNPMSRSLPVGQSLILSHLRHDVLSAKGKNAFFAHLNLPHYPYAYDRNCQLRTDPASWRGKAPYTDKNEPDGELKRWEDYNQQLFCTYAQINYLIKDLKTAKLLDKTTIVIHGDKGADIQREKKDDAEATRTDRMLYRFKNNLPTVFAVYKPKNTAKTDPLPCDVATLVSRHVLENTSEVCQPPSLISYTKEEQDKSIAWLKIPVDEKYLKTAEYASLYASWLENGGQAFMASLDERLKQEQKGASSSKLSFVAPPAFTDAPKKEEPSLFTKEKTTSFVPVPEKEEKTEALSGQKTETAAGDLPSVAVNELPPAVANEVPAIAESPAAGEQPLVADKEEKAGKKQKEKKKKGKKKEKSEQPSASPDMSLPAEQPTVPDVQTKTDIPAAEVIVDDFGALPKPIVLPKSSAEEKWKTTDIKDGQKTSLELLPPGLEELPALPEAAAVTEEQPLPQASPSAQVKLLPPPAVPAPDLTLPELPSPQQIPDMNAPSEAHGTSVAGNAGQALTGNEAEAIAAAETQIKAAEETKAKAEADLQAIAKAEEEARMKAEAEAAAKAKAEEEARLKAEAEAAAKAKAEEEARLKAQAEAAAKAKVEEEARLKAQAEAAAKAKAEEEARMKAEAEAAAKAKAKEEARLKAEAEAAAKAKAEEEARLKAQAEAAAKAKAEEEARLKAQAEAAAKAKAEEEARLKAEAEAAAKAKAEEEEMRKKTPPPPPANADELDIVRETTIERINEDGEVETFIYLERRPNPNKFKKKNLPQRELPQDLERSPTKTVIDVPEQKTSVSSPETASAKQDDAHTLLNDEPENSTTEQKLEAVPPSAGKAEAKPDETAPEKTMTEKPAESAVPPPSAENRRPEIFAPVERVLED